MQRENPAGGEMFAINLAGFGGEQVHGNGVAGKRVDGDQIVIVAFTRFQFTL